MLPRHASGPPTDGFLGRLTRRSAEVCARRPRAVVALWIALVVGLVVAGSMTGTRALTGADAGVGESGRADARIAASGLQVPAVENVLLRSADPARTATAARELVRTVRALPDVASVRGPSDAADLSTAGGRTGLVQVSLRGGPEDAADHVEGLNDAVARLARTHPGVDVDAAGPGTIDAAIGDVISQELRTAELISLPVTLVILLLVFGAFVAACVPLLLGLTSVIAAMGALGPLSQAFPVDDSTSTLIVLLGLAVGVDYSLFAIRREREERRRGHDADAALRATAATVGRAIVISGLIVLVAVAGLAMTGLPMFVSMALGTMLVVAIAVLGSLTVLPAVLHLLGDRLDRGRLPGGRRRAARRARLDAAAVVRRGAAHRRGPWAAIARGVTRRPVLSLIATVSALAALAVPMLGMEIGDSEGAGLPIDTPVLVAQAQIERAFPGAPETADLVVRGGRLDDARLDRLGRHALDITGGRGTVATTVAQDGRTALLRVPMADRGEAGADRTVQRLRDELGAGVDVTGRAAVAKDFNDRLTSATPIVIGLVLALALLLLLATFRSWRLAVGVLALNLLSVGATYGILTAVFQHTWAEGLLDFTSNGTITSWVPLTTFVILFGLSMDYTILVLERIREARREGLDARAAAADGVGATAGTVTGAAVVMVAIFAIFPTLPLVEMKMTGVALACGVLLDATIVRGFALPAVVALLGDRGIKPATTAVSAERARRGWDDRGRMSATALHSDAR